jgi:hypothetical protein
VDEDEEAQDLDMLLAPRKKITTVKKGRVAAVTRKKVDSRDEGRMKEKKKTMPREAVALDEEEKENEYEEEEEVVELPRPVAKVKDSPIGRKKAAPKKAAVPKKKSRSSDDVLEYDKEGNEIRKRE